MSRLPCISFTEVAEVPHASIATVSYTHLDVYKRQTFGHIYAVDKSGVSAWVRHAASCYGQYGVRINAVCPGGLQSDRTNPVFAKEYSKHTQLGLSLIHISPV